MKTTILLLQFAGVMHLGLIAAGLLMPRVVNLRTHIATLPPFIARLFWVYYAFIGTCLVSFGALSLFGAAELASGTALARAVCGFLAVFWTLRLVAAAFVFDVRPYLTNDWLKAGYQLTNVAFALLPVIYLWAAVKGGAE
jgi:hypothetical protein